MSDPTEREKLIRFGCCTPEQADRLLAEQAKLSTAYFTFGQDHVHSVNGRTFDKDTVVRITAKDPRQVMFNTFGRKWSMQYDTPPDMTHFAEIVDL